MPGGEVPVYHGEKPGERHPGVTEERIHHLPGVSGVVRIEPKVDHPGGGGHPVPEDEFPIVPVEGEDNAALLVSGTEVRGVTLARGVLGYETHVMPPLAEVADTRGGEVLVRQDFHLPVGRA